MVSIRRPKQQHSQRYNNPRNWQQPNNNNNGRTSSSMICRYVLLAYIAFGTFQIAFQNSSFHPSPQKRRKQNSAAPPPSQTTTLSAGGSIKSLRDVLQDSKRWSSSERRRRGRSSEDATTAAADEHGNNNNGIINSRRYHFYYDHTKDDAAAVPLDRANDAMVMNRVGSGPTDVAYVLDFSHERRRRGQSAAQSTLLAQLENELREERQAAELAYRKLLLQDQTQSSSQEQRKLRSCTFVNASNANHPLQQSQRCLEAVEDDSVAILYNSLPFDRTVCGKRIPARGAVQMDENDEASVANNCTDDFRMARVDFSSIGTTTGISTTTTTTNDFWSNNGAMIELPPLSSSSSLAGGGQQQRQQRAEICEVVPLQRQVQQQEEQDGGTISGNEAKGVNNEQRQRVLHRPFRESWHYGNSTIAKGKETVVEGTEVDCDEGRTFVESTFEVNGSMIFTRTVVAHDGVFDMMIIPGANDFETSLTTPPDRDIVLRLGVNVRNGEEDAAYFPDTHVVARKPSARSALFRSATIRDRKTTVTVIADFAADTMRSPAEGTLDIGVVRAGETFEAQEIRRIRIIMENHHHHRKNVRPPQPLEDNNYINEDNNNMNKKITTEYHPTSFASVMTQDFLYPLSLYHHSHHNSKIKKQQTPVQQQRRPWISTFFGIY